MIHGSNNKIYNNITYNMKENSIYKYITITQGIIN